MKELTMLVDCVSRDYADPEAVSGSSTINREEKPPITGGFLMQLSLEKAKNR